ncbi:hypothetical protein H4R20_000677 [Coemansia guatemalensis]|uniref:Uncharacterized protein n=1 Tax=Coemansia guatemalensis TaxID=2761395 RepID=A0A9W8I7A5_9FUNG|nr:hypothetical protein H4R20_000677 [Coemansia guatemalensis]
MPLDSLRLPTAGMHITIASTDAAPAAGPDKIVTGHVSVPEASLSGVDRIEIQYRGVEVVGGTLDDYEDHSLDGLILKEGARALNKLYFDERLVLWERDRDAPASAQQLLFSIAYPNANYPGEVKSVCRSAPSQSFEIAYHVAVWLVGPDNKPVAREVQCVPFVPVFSRKASAIPPAPVSQTGYDDRGKECLLTRVTLSQTDYVPGDQVVAGVYIECLRANRSIRKAECTLRQRIECRMRRTFSPIETAEIVSNSRPQSSQPSAASDDSDVLWSRTIDVCPPQQLTLTTSGVGLAAAAASASSSTTQLHSSTAASRSSQISDSGEIPHKRDSSISRTMSSRSPAGLMAGFRSCSANMHTSLPSSASMVSGHFLLFSYELQIDVTVGSLARGGQRVSTHTLLGSSAVEPSTPTSARFSAPHRALAEAHANSRCVSATASYFPQNALHTPASLMDSREKADLRKSRFSTGAFQPPTRTEAAIADDAARRFSALRSAPIHRESSMVSAAEDAGDNVSELPNAVDQLRYRCEASLALVPKIFDSSKREAHEAPQEKTNNVSASGIAAISPTPTDPSASEEAPSPSKAGKMFIGTALKTNSEDALQKSPTTASNDQANETEPASEPQDTKTTTKRESTTSSAGEDDLARAVYAAAEKVMNDEEWDRPNSCYLPAKGSKRKSKAVGRAQQGNSSSNSNGQPTPNADSGHNSSRNSSESSHYSDMDREDLERAINRLAPTKRTPESRSGASGLTDIIQGIDFFGSTNDGPELIGMLSAPPEKLVFDELQIDDAKKAQPDANGRVVSSSAAYPPVADGQVSVQPGWTMFTPPAPQPQQISSVLRRSISMPESSALANTGSAELTQQAGAADVPAPTVAHSALDPGEYRSVLVRKSRLGKLDPSRLSAMSPSSVISAMSSNSRLGSTSRSGMLKNIGQRFTSWFSKK